MNYINMYALKSKTVLMGLAVALIPFLQALQALPLTQTQAQVLSGVLGILVVINRFYTSTPIGDKKVVEQIG